MITLVQLYKRQIFSVVVITAIAVGIIFSPFVCPVYWDEMPQYRIGEYNFNQYVLVFDHIFGTSFSDPAFADFDRFGDKDYGSVFEVFISGIGRIAAKLFPEFGLAELIILKHFAVYLVFMLGTYGVYSIARRRLECQYGGLLAAAVFFLSPRLFGNAFYNSKDIVFLSFFVLSINYVILAAETGKARSILLASIFTALAVSVRFIGIFSLFLGIFVWFVSWYRDGWSFKKISLYIFFTAILILLLIYALYPFLWPSPMFRARDIVLAMSKFSRHPDWSLFDGEWIRSSLKPFYLLRWMSVTLPCTFIVASLCGQLPAMALIIKRTLKFSLWKNQKELTDYISVGLGLAPLLLSFIKHPWLYDGWRHFYFLMPFFSISAAVGIFNIVSVLPSIKARITAASWLAFTVILESLAGIVYFFPYPNCYFNVLAGANLIARYDLDYAETSGYAAMVKVLSFNPKISKPLSVAAVGMDLSKVSPRLGQAEKLLDLNEKIMPDYVITKGAALSVTEKQLYNEIYAVKTVSGEVLARILAPNEKRDRICKQKQEKCVIHR